ncbi:MAG: hypothetical protein WCE30_10245 [Mycobacterium sp.]
MPDNTTDNATDDGTDTEPPACQQQPLRRDAAPPPPFAYQGQTVNPTFDPNIGQWGFWFQSKWVPLYEPGC